MALRSRLTGALASTEGALAVATPATRAIHTPATEAIVLPSGNMLVGFLCVERKEEEEETVTLASSVERKGRKQN